MASPLDAKSMLPLTVLLLVCVAVLFGSYFLSLGDGSAYRNLRKRSVSVREGWHTSQSAHGPWRLSQAPAVALGLTFALLYGTGAAAPWRAAGIQSIEPPWYVTRMPGGVGGEAPRGASLSRLGL